MNSLALLEIEGQDARKAYEHKEYIESYNNYGTTIIKKIDRKNKRMKSQDFDHDAFDRETL